MSHQPYQKYQEGSTLLQLNSHISKPHNIGKIDVDVTVLNIVPHKMMMNCIHELNDIPQNETPFLSSDDDRMMHKI